MKFRATVGAALCGLLLSTSATAYAASPKSPAPEGPAGQWQLTWADEFRGNTLSDAWINGWFPDGSGTSNNVSEWEWDCNVDRNVRVHGGALELRLTEETTHCRGKDQPYASALVNTNGSVTVKPGEYVEARIKTDSVDGNVANWPAFWLDGQNWPVDGEIDIMEGGWDGACYNVHTVERPGGPGTCVELDPTKWHTYGVLRNLDGTADFYYDGQYVGSMPFDVSSEEYIILNQAVGPWSAVKAPATMKVDYVRVFSQS